MTPYKFLTVLSLTVALALGSSPAWCSKAPAKSETLEQEHKLLSEEPSLSPLIYSAVILLRRIFPNLR